MTPIRIARELARETDKFQPGPPVAYVYNPLIYARRPHEAYLRRYGGGSKEVILMGMNPGPWGMAQTGVPFGEISMVRDWMGIEEPVEKPPREHPQRPVTGFECHRSEVSGVRFWGWARDRFGSAEAFFERFFVWNYCPLSFLEESGRNRTPDKLPAAEKAELFPTCDKALKRIVGAFGPRYVIGVGMFAAQRIRESFEEDESLILGEIMHPSPANPKANKNWARTIEKALARYGISLN